MEGETVGSQRLLEAAEMRKALEQATAELNRRNEETLRHTRWGNYAQWASALTASAALVFSALAVAGVYEQSITSQNVAWSQARAAEAQAQSATAQTQAVKAQTEAVTAQTWQLVIQVQTLLSRTFIERPELWPYFDQGQLPPDADSDENKKLRNQIMAVAELYLDWIDNFEDEAFYKIPGMGKGERERELWEAYFVHLFRKAPALCVRMSDTGSLYRERVREHASDGCPVGTYTPRTEPLR